MDLWFAEPHGPHHGLAFRVERVLASEETPHQRLDIVELGAFGRALFLDGALMLTEGDEFIYHEMLVHVPLCSHPRPRRVLVVGGGDGGALREVLRHREVERCAVVELDGRVVERCREHFPWAESAFSDPRAEVHLGDGAKFLRGRTGPWDAILVDSPDPVGPAASLTSPSFYRRARGALAEGGLLAAQAQSPVAHPRDVRRIFGHLRRAFPRVSPYLATVPTYPGALWSFALAGPSVAGRLRRPPGGLRYYSPAVHRAAFALPPFVREMTG